MVIWVLMNAKSGKKTPMIFSRSTRINPSASCEWSQGFAELEMEKTSQSLLLSWPRKERLVFFGPSSTFGFFMQFSAAPHSQMSSTELLCWFNNYPKCQVLSACRRFSAELQHAAGILPCGHWISTGDTLQKWKNWTKSKKQSSFPTSENEQSFNSLYYSWCLAFL